MCKLTYVPNSVIGRGKKNRKDPVQEIKKRKAESMEKIKTKKRKLQKSTKHGDVITKKVKVSKRKSSTQVPQNMNL